MNSVATQHRSLQGVCLRVSQRSGLPCPWACLWCCLGLRETLGLISQLLKESLRQYVDRIFTVITKSGVSCPTVMCDIFFSLREAAAKRFQGEPRGLSRGTRTQPSWLIILQSLGKNTVECEHGLPELPSDGFFFGS